MSSEWFFTFSNYWEKLEVYFGDLSKLNGTETSVSINKVWHIATLIFRYMTHSSFYTTLAELSSVSETLQPVRPQIFVLWPFMGKICQSLCSRLKPLGSHGVVSNPGSTTCQMGDHQFCYLKIEIRLGTVAHTYSPICCDAEVGGLLEPRISAQPGKQ